MFVHMSHVFLFEQKLHLCCKTRQHWGFSLAVSDKISMFCLGSLTPETHFSLPAAIVLGKIEILLMWLIPFIKLYFISFLIPNRKLIQFHSSKLENRHKKWKNLFLISFLLNWFKLFNFISINLMTFQILNHSVWFLMIDCCYTIKIVVVVHFGCKLIRLSMFLLLHSL